MYFEVLCLLTASGADAAEKSSPLDISVGSEWVEFLEIKKAKTNKVAHYFNVY